VRDLAKFPTAQIDTEIILKAIETMRRYRLSFWHASSFQAALHGGATILCTADLGQVIETLSVENPFRARELTGRLSRGLSRQSDHAQGRKSQDLPNMKAG
jgi:hypothetical protein